MSSDEFYKTHNHLMALCLGLPRWAGTGKVKPIWILLKQETVSGTGISWAICKSAPHSRQTTTPAQLSFYRPFLLPNQQQQSTVGKKHHMNNKYGKIMWTYFVLLVHNHYSIWYKIHCSHTALHKNILMSICYWAARQQWNVWFTWCAKHEHMTMISQK